MAEAAKATKWSRSLAAEVALIRGLASSGSAAGQGGGRRKIVGAD